MKRIFLSALIGVGMAALIFQISSGSEAARTQARHPPSPTPTPTTPGGILRIPLPGRPPIPPGVIDTVRTNVALASNGGVASASSELDATRTAGAAINGDRFGLHWGSDPATGSGWCDATRGVYPDWLRVDFKGKKTIDEIDVFSVQDNVAAPDTTGRGGLLFTKYGITDFDVQYWDGSDWVTITSVSGNNNVGRRFSFPAVKTTAIRILVKNAVDDYSRIVELEAWGY